ncbi:MAG: AbrB/MazE/SpoVT family DNA-binding domain-containing protein [Planctomycetes bacterium]|nr:AbrB/MazE/SpoVT family DNA-binding domain-containing protein [Planctomycetota bacterium]
MQTANVVTHGCNQSVELPAGFHLDGNEVYVKHLGKSVLLIPKNADPWDLMAESLDQFTDDYLRDRSQPAQQLREEPFA